jgi:hypothetical protein
MEGLRSLGMERALVWPGESHPKAQEAKSLWLSVLVPRLALAARQGTRRRVSLLLRVDEQPLIGGFALL